MSSSRHSISMVIAQCGFTLVELMISMVLGLLVIGGVSAVFLSNKQTYSTNNGLSQIQDNSRVAFELLSRDLREAGATGCGNAGRVANVLRNGPNAGGTVAWYTDFSNNMIRGYDATVTDPAVASGGGAGQRLSSTSSIQVVEADGAGVTVASHNTTASTITLNESASPFSAGDFVVICDPDHAAVAQATAVTTSNPPVLTMAAGSGSPGNCLTGLGFPTGCTTSNSYQYILNAQVSKLYAADWYIGTNPLGGTSLYRMTLVNNSGTPTATAQEMVRNVTDMQITYHLLNGASFVSAAAVGTNWVQVDGVMLTLNLRSVSKVGTNSQEINRTIPITVALRSRLTS